MNIRIDRLVNRERIPVDEAKEEVLERERNDLSKWRKLYAGGDEEWVYWRREYYDFVTNTFTHNQDETLRMALDAIAKRDDAS